jgi:Tfp pilus assembly protein PilZ
MMRERRKELRKTLMAYTQVFDLYGGYLIGYLADLNLRGAMAISRKPVAESREITIAIELPDLPEINAARIILPAHVVWCQPDISPEFHNVGFEFREVADSQKNVIQAIIDNYEFRRDMPNYPLKPSLRR